MRALTAPIFMICVAAATSAAARDLPLAIPVDCTLGDSCFIQQYVDHDNGPGAHDFTCGPLSYDGHKGTDFGLPSFAAMRAGVDVLAAAPGTVAGTRDELPDTGWSPEFEGKDCGNGVVIDHGGGWQTQYCHMKRGSITVEPGQRVAMNTVLGKIGFSGRTQFPHLHLSVRQDGKVVDPFDPDGQITCDMVDDSPLWSATLDYMPGGLLSAGFADAVPAYDAIKDGTAHAGTLPASTDAVVLWGYAFGAKAGDTIRLVIESPDGTRFFSHDAAVADAKAQLFRAAGKRLRSPMASGSYRGEVTLIRAGRVIDQMQTQLRVD
ncbi:M23 family metallopeptidase [Lutimaribacter sp. EGI FJ00015]|uniref:M23 family metallopeptidase n=1 Tax=Lutimaribacter degradans TaxID=2945989 RepID=A0ACC5ZWF6_9RHOB|nr:M23 family metallopeptidase [Lutimaribacter sp. EGI FJ00013]MCM2562657.1 M23 family metallopeptidase [Lutimaribacter sp. EGI FJ00013]MCO0613814.1 M23 family metallopeptidase [Lutimaribacter sp. EGI FJ00015]MCO0636703.1 M23 family metallopeptidase [Lutimaribacter sp. EGI FJ00014]